MIFINSNWQSPDFADCVEPPCFSTQHLIEFPVERGTDAMDRNTYYINDKTDIFFYFEIIRQTKALRILDIGMFLKRIGAVARQVGDAQMDPDILLDGLDDTNTPQLPIYKSIYHHIYHTPAEIHTATDSSPGRMYDLAIMLHPEALFAHVDIQEIYERLPGSTKQLAVSCPNRGQLNRLQRYGTVSDLTVDDRLYALVTPNQ